VDDDRDYMVKLFEVDESFFKKPLESKICLYVREHAKEDALG